MEQIWCETKRSLAPLAALAVLMVSFGLIFLGNIGPFTLPDAGMHVNGVYTIATGQVYDGSQDFTDIHGNTSRALLIKTDSGIVDAATSNKTVGSAIAGFPRVKDDDLKKQKEDLSKRWCGETTAHGTRMQYYPIGYVVPGITMATAMSFGGTFWDAYQAARIANLLFCLLVVGAAVVLIPRGKWILALSASMPACVFLESSIHGDAPLLPLIALLVALACRALSAGMMSKPAMVACIVVSFVLCLDKTAYAPIPLMLLALPSSVISRRNKVLSFAIVAVAFIAVYFSWKGITGYNEVLFNKNYESGMDWICTHPLPFLASIVISFAGVPYYLLLQPGFVWVPLVIIAALAIVQQRTLLAAQVREKASWRTWAARWRLPLSAASVAVLSVLLLLVALAVTWHDYQTAGWAVLINGVQERYFTPLIPLVATLLFPIAVHGEDVA